MDELTREFLIESQEGLDRMERCLTDLETRPQDAELLGEIFRSVHTIKGTTGFLGFKRLEKLAHSGENLLGLLRDGKLSADQNLITGLLHLLDGLRSILKSIETVEGEGEGDDSALIAQLEQLQAPSAGSSVKIPVQVQQAVHAGAAPQADAPIQAPAPVQAAAPPPPQTPAVKPAAAAQIPQPEQRG